MPQELSTTMPSTLRATVELMTKFLQEKGLAAEFDLYISTHQHEEKRSWVLPNEVKQSEPATSQDVNASSPKRYSKKDGRWMDEQPADQVVSQTSRSQPVPELHGGPPGIWTAQDDGRWTSQQQAKHQPPTSQNQNVPDSHGGPECNWVKHGSSWQVADGRETIHEQPGLMSWVLTI